MEAATGCQMLSIPRGAAEIHAWFGARRASRLEDIARVTASASPRKVLLAIGEAARGLAGWRLTHRQAESAAAIAQLRGQALTSYRDVAVEAAALEDQALGDILIARCLAPLDDPRGGGKVRRQVLEAVFAAEHNKASAAHALGINRDTVSRHVGEIERRLGCPLRELHAEIEIALRVEALRRLRGPVDGGYPLDQSAP